MELICAWTSLSMSLLVRCYSERLGSFIASHNTSITMFAYLATAVRSARAPVRSMATKPADPVQALFIKHLEAAKKAVYANGAVRAPTLILILNAHSQQALGRVVRGRSLRATAVLCRARGR